MLDAAQIVVDGDCITVLRPGGKRLTLRFTEVATRQGSLGPSQYARALICSRRKGSTSRCTLMPVSRKKVSTLRTKSISLSFS